MSNQGRKVTLAVAGSVGLHVLVLFLWALTVGFLPRRSPEDLSRPKPLLKVTLQTETPAPAIPPALTATPTPPPIQFADTTGMVEAATPPPGARVESGRNTVDSSELPASGSERGPGQKGDKIPTFALNTPTYSAEARPGPVEPTTSSPPTPPPETAPPLPRAAPKPTAPPAAPAATPAPRTGAIALATPASLPTEPEPEPNPFDPAFRPPSTLTEPPRPTPVPTRDYYRPQPLKTSLTGNISTLGSASVASVNTPTGRYRAVIRAAVQRRWNGYIENRMGLMTVGTVTVKFLVGMDGKARGVQVVSNTANESLAAISLRAIMEAGIPPMPAEAVPATGGGQLPMDLTFELIDPPHL